MKNCPECLEDFIPSSNHRACPKCRYAMRKDLCQCGQEKSFKSSMCLRCWGDAQKLEKNGNWRGGKTRHKKGYVMVKAPEHPRSRSNSGYVFEHILVMEEHLGRNLVDGENIHHINGVKDDNRIENLELWTKPQPSGIRVEDAVAWAKEILRLYDK